MNRFNQWIIRKCFKDDAW